MHTQRNIMLSLVACLIGCGSTHDDIVLDASPGAAHAGDAASDSDASVTVITGPKAYVGLFGEDTVAVFDLNQKRVIKRIPVTAPDGIVLSADGHQVFVSSTDSGTVKVLSTADDTLADSIDVGAKPAGLTVTPDGRTLVAAVSGANQAVLIDARSHAVLARAPVTLAHASCVSADSEYAYVGSQDVHAPAVIKLDLKGDDAPVRLPVAASPRALACEAVRLYFTAVGVDAVQPLELATGKQLTPIRTGGSPHHLLALEPGKTALVVSQTAGDLELIDEARGTVTGKIATGKLAHWIALSADRSRAYVTNEGDDNLAVVDLARKVVLERIPVGKAPRKLVLLP